MAIIGFPVGRRGMTLRVWLTMRLEQAVEQRHPRRADRFRDALALLSTGSIARAVDAVPTRDRAAALKLAADAIARRAAARRGGRGEA